MTIRRRETRKQRTKKIQCSPLERSCKHCKLPEPLKCDGDVIYTKQALLEDGGKSTVKGLCPDRRRFAPERAWNVSLVCWCKILHFRRILRPRSASTTILAQEMQIPAYYHRHYNRKDFALQSVLEDERSDTECRRMPQQQSARNLRRLADKRSRLASQGCHRVRLRPKFVQNGEENTGRSCSK